MTSTVDDLFSLPAGPEVWVSHFRDRLNSEVDRLRRGRSGAVPRELMVDAATAVFEEVLTIIERALADSQSQLSRQLKALPGSARVLESELKTARTAQYAASRGEGGRLAAIARKTLGALLVGVAIEVGGAIASQSLLPGSTSPTDISVNTAAEISVAFDSAACEMESSMSSASGTGVDPHRDPVSESPGAGSDNPDEDWPDHDLLDDDPWAELQDNDGNYRVPWSDDDHVGTLWREAGFSPADAEDWASTGMDPDEAAWWAGERFVPHEASQWVLEGFGADEAAEWRAELFDSSEATKWSESDFTPEEAYGWQASDFAADEAAEWRDSEVGLDDAAEWRDAGFTPAVSAMHIEAGTDLSTLTDG